MVPDGAEGFFEVGDRYTKAGRRFPEMALDPTDEVFLMSGFEEVLSVLDGTVTEFILDVG